jgi:hypothetical protein
LPGDTVTIELQGRVTLEQFAEAVARFHRLIAALSADSKADDVRWEINALEVGSTTATAQGVSQNGDAPERIEQVVRNYLEVGRALESGATVPYPAPVRKEAEGFVAMLRSGIEAVRFETAESEAIVREAAATPAAQPVESAPTLGSYGAVTGRVQTLTSRLHLRFTLYDRLHDRAVSCYLAEGRESLMREMWDKLATVEGWVTRDPLSGRPLAVRRITNVTPLLEAAPQDYMNARGVRPLGPNDPSPEEAIRRIRDGG